MNQRVFLDVLDHLVSHFGGRGRGGNWNFFFRFWFLGFFEAGQGVPRSLKWAYTCFSHLTSISMGVDVGQPLKPLKTRLVPSNVGHLLGRPNFERSEIVYHYG